MSRGPTSPGTPATGLPAAGPVTPSAPGASPSAGTTAAATTTAPKNDYKKLLKPVERKSSKKGGIDSFLGTSVLMNVLAGYKQDGTRSDLHKVAAMLPLPYEGQAAGEQTAVKKYLTRANTALEKRLRDALDLLDQSLSPRINALDIMDTDAVADLIEAIKLKKPGLNATSPEVSLLMQHLAIKHMAKVIQQHRIKKDDSPAAIQRKMAACNLQFKTEMAKHYRAIQQKLMGKDPALRIKNTAGLQAAINLLTEANTTAADLAGKFAIAKQRHLNLAANLGEQADMPDRIAPALQVAVEKEQQALEAIKDEHEPAGTASTPATADRVAINWACDHAIAERIYEAYPTDFNRLALDRITAARPAAGSYDEDKVAEALQEADATIGKVAAALVTQQKYAESQHRAEHDNNSTEARLAELRKDHQDNMSAAAAIEYAETPHPDALATLDEHLTASHQQYREELRAIHKAAGTLPILNAVSGPLEQLRRATGGTARLPILDLGKCETQGKVSESFVTLNGLCAAANQTLAELEELETAVAMHPTLAADYRDKIDAKTKKLRDQMQAVSEQMRRMEATGLAQTHPDIGQLSQAVSSLCGSSNATHHAGAQAHMGQNLGTTYWKQDGMFKWHQETLKCTLKGKDGKELKDKDDNPRVEEVIFNREEMATHFDTFCQQHNLTGDRRPVYRESNRTGNVEITWPNIRVSDGKSQQGTRLRDMWLEFLKDKYNTKRVAEIEKEDAYKAKVSVGKGGAATSASAVTAAPAAGVAAGGPPTAGP